MPPQPAPRPTQRLLARAFRPARLAPAVLAQVYELLFPDLRRPVPRPPPNAAPAPTAIPHARAAL
jgi:hypothetical protein